MRKRKLFIIITIPAVVLLCSALLVAYASNAYGSKSDPLIAKSYLDEVYAPELLEKFSDEIKEQSDSLNSSYELVTLSKGQKLICSTGCSFLLRSGTVKSGNSGETELIDSTTAKSVSANAVLSTNHLYLFVSEGATIIAESQASLLVSGVYSIG